MATKLASKPVYCCISDDELVIVNSDLTCYYLGYYHNFYSKKGDNITGVLGGYVDTNQPASVYLGKTFDQSLNNKGLQIYDCTNNPNEVYLNCTDRKITTTYNSAYIPIFCVATGVKNEVLAVAKNGDIYGGNMNTGTLIKIGTINGAYRCVMDYDMNMNALFFIISLDGKLTRISSYSTSFSIIATTTNVYDVCYNRCSSILGGTGIIALKRDNCLYKLDSSTLAQQGNALVTSVGLLMHQSQVGWHGTQTGYITLDGIPKYNVYGSSPSSIIADTKTWTYSKPAIEPTNIINLPINLDGTYTTAPNKLKYFYRVIYQYAGFVNGSNVVNYVTEWGMDSNCGNRFEPSCGSVEFTSTNASNSVQILSQAANAAINRLQEELNKYIGPFDNTKNTRTGSHKSKGNNQTYYWKIEATGKIDQYTSTGANATFKALWGTSPNNYTVTYISSNFTKGSIVHDGETIKDVYSMSSDGTVNFRITPITYSHREAVFTEIINKLKNNLELQFDSYIGTVETTYPYISRSITSAGTNYYARVYPTSSGNTSITATKAILTLKLYWSAGLETVDSEFGTGKASVPGNAGDGVKELTINASNYTNLENFITTEATTMLNTWEAYARTLFSKLTQAPGKQEDSWNTTTGNKIWVLMTFSLDSNPTTMADQTKQIINTKFKYSLTSATCDKEYKDGSITLDSTNYSMKETLFQNHFNATVAEFKNDFSFLNSVPPEDNTINHTALNGLTYTCKYSWEFAERDASRAVYRLVSSYSLASDLSNATEFSRQRTVEVDRNTVAYDIRMQRFNAAYELEKVALENHLNTLLASVTIPEPVKNDSFVATNGRLYAYRVLCTVAPGDSDAEKKVTIKSEWGKTTTYGNEFATSTFTLTAVNQKAFDSTVARVMRAHQVKMEGFLNLLIEDVIFQGANGTKRASNGSNYNYRTSVTGVGITTKTPAQYIQETGTIETFSE